MNLDDIDWHDGMLAHISIECNKVSIHCEIFMHEQSKDKDKIRLTFTGTKEFTCSIDLDALEDNAKAGNITNARLEIGNNGARLKIFLTDGYLDVKGRHLEIEHIQI